MVYEGKSRMIWGYPILGNLYILGAIASRPIFAASSGTIKRKHPARKGTLERSMLDVVHPGGQFWLEVPGSTLETARIQ